MAVAEALSIYGLKRAPELPSASRIGFAMIRLIEWWGDRTVDIVNPESCSAYTKYRLGMGVTPGSVALDLSLLRAAMNHRVKNGHLTLGPFIQLPPRQPARNRWLTRSEAARLLNASRRFNSHQLSLFILIALYTGARRGAILGFRWDQVDFERGRINFNEPGRPITTKRRPIIQIPRQLLWFLRAARRKADSPWVISYRGGRIADIRNSFEEARARAGIGRDVTAHTLRHTCGTLVGSGWRRPLSDRWLARSHESADD
jgi:integrase